MAGTPVVEVVRAVSLHHDALRDIEARTSSFADFFDDLEVEPERH
jgi:hypothetical protein